MVSYYNAASGLAMLTGSGRSHYHPHHHHSPPSQSAYFSSAAGAGYSPYHTHGHPHSHSHQQTGGGSPLGVGMGLGIGGVGVGSPQFSSSADINCNHPQYPHPHTQFNSMMATPESWHHQAYNSACDRGYEMWNNHMHHMGTPTAHHPSFYHHAQPSPPSSTPSPQQTHLSITAVPPTATTPQSPNGGYGGNGNDPNTTPNGSSTPPFKTEFGPCSSGNQQESAQGLSSQGQVVVSTANGQIAAPHSPDSGMANSDGVSSSGSPAQGLGGQQYGQSQPQQCLGGPASSGAGSSASMSSTSSAEMQIHLGSQYSITHHHVSHAHLINVSNGGRPTQARSPYEWMKKPACSTVPNNAKTRTKDKYRVVYSDTQRLELEKEFHYNRYITIRRKSELAVTLGLSERQVKIWFQNRRAKERKILRKREEMSGRDKLGMLHMPNPMSGMGHNPMCNPLM